MRGMLLGLAVMVLGGVARGEVVGLATPFTGSDGQIAIGTSSGAGGKTVAFVPTEPGSYGAFVIEIRQMVSGDSLNSITLGVQTLSSGQAVQSNNFTRSGLNLAYNTTGALSFDLSSMTFLASNSEINFWVSGVTSQNNTIGGSDIFWRTRSTLVSGDYTGNWSSGSILNANKGLFAINYTPVPEPGTLLLGGIAAVCGGGGVWWRRKRKVEVVETVETVTAV